jgi:hypothetical protein
VDDMHSEEPQRDVMAQGDEATAATGEGDGRTGRPRLSRRQAMGRMSAVATAGAVAWVVPEILTAKPAAGAALSNAVGGGGGGGGSAGVSTSASTGGTGASVGASGTVGTNGPQGVTTAADTTAASPTSLAFTGLNIQRDAEVGAALVAGGWAMQHWASRTPKPAVAGPSGAHQAEGAGGGA